MDSYDRSNRADIQAPCPRRDTQSVPLPDRDVSSYRLTSFTPPHKPKPHIHSQSETVPHILSQSQLTAQPTPHLTPRLIFQSSSQLAAHLTPQPPPNRKSIDVQTDDRAGLWNTTSQRTSAFSPFHMPSTDSNIQPPATAVSCASDSLQTTSPSATTHDIAKYIENKMKEQYIEQTRTLEQLQLHMRQQLMEKQAQLLEELKTFDSPQKAAGNRSQSSPGGDAVQTSAATAVTTNRQNYSAATPSCHSKLFSNHNGRQEGPSFSADESINGNTSQASSHASSHDTWDSSNAFAHERPVLTGSERSTPTATLLPAASSNSDVELISQSVHIPYSDDNNRSGDVSIGLDGGGVNGVSVAGADADLITFSSGLAAADAINALNQKAQEDADTPRNAAQDSRGTNGVTITPNTLLLVSNSQTLSGARMGQVNAADTMSPIQVNTRSPPSSANSTPPPESPADELSTSLRLSLRQKHSRHLADMKSYYEQELEGLRQQLSSAEAISQHASYRRLECENQALSERCRVLEEELLRSTRYINKVDRQMEDLEASFNASLSAQTVSDKAADKSDIDTCKRQLESAQSHINSLESRNKELFSALCDAYEVRDNTARAATQESKKYQQLQEKYSSLKSQQDHMSHELRTTKSSLADAQLEIGSLKTSSISGLEAQRRLDECGDRYGLSPMLKAEHQHMVNMSSTPALPSNQKNSGDPNRHLSTADHLNNGSSQSSPQCPTSDLSPSQLHQSDTQSSESSREPAPIKSRSQKRTNHHQRGRSHDKPSSSYTAAPPPSRHTSCKDDLFNAYSPIVDRQRHSSSASSNGPVKAATTAASPLRQSQERPFGFHHVGACMSPSKRTQQWAILSPFNRTPDYSKNREAPKQTTPNSAKKSLDFSPQRSKSASTVSSTSHSSHKKEDQDTVLEKIKGGYIYSEPEKLEDNSQRTVSPRTFRASKTRTERVKLIRDAETRLDELLLEKRQLESSLTRISTTHSRKDRQRQESLERQLDTVNKDLGCVRMTLRRHNAL